MKIRPFTNPINILPLAMFNQSLTALLAYIPGGSYDHPARRRGGAALVRAGLTPMRCSTKDPPQEGYPAASSAYQGPD